MVGEVAKNLNTTAEVLKRTCDLHAQAASLGDEHSRALICIQDTTSSIPRRLDQLEVKLDKVLADASVLKSMSVSSGTTLELNSRAIRHMVRERANPGTALRGPRTRGGSSSSSTADSKDPVADTPRLLDWHETIDQSSSGLALDQPVSPESKSLFIPSALERSTLVEGLARQSGDSTSVSSDTSHTLEVEDLDAFDWDLAASAARALVASRLAAAEEEQSHGVQAVVGQSPLTEIGTSGGEQPIEGDVPRSLVGAIGEPLASGSTGVGSSLAASTVPSGEPGTDPWAYDHASAHEAVRASSRMAE